MAGRALVSDYGWEHSGGSAIALLHVYGKRGYMLNSLQ